MKYTNKIIFIFLFVFSNINSIKKFNENRDIKFNKFNFDRNLSFYENNESPMNIAKQLFYNQIFINLIIGKQKIPFDLYLQKYPFSIQSFNVNESEVKGIYNEDESESYIKIKEIETKSIGELKIYYQSKDIIEEFNNTEIKFLLIKQHSLMKSHVNEGGSIGFKINGNSQEFNGFNLLDQLKQKNLISTLCFSFNYTTEDSGELILGAYPHEYDPKNFDINYYIETYADQFDFNVEWLWIFDNIYLNDDLIQTDDNFGYFYPEIGYIIANKDYKKNLIKTKFFFEVLNNSSKCQKILFNITDFISFEADSNLKDTYETYYCNNDVDISETPSLTFIKKPLNVSFSLNYSNLWTKRGDYKYFLIVTRVREIDSFWYLGKPFFNKYNFIFNIEKKNIGLYLTKENSNSNNLIELKFLIIILISCVIIIILVIVIIVKFCCKKPRKKRSNELKEDYDFFNEKKGGNFKLDNEEN